MDVFELQRQVVDDDATFARSFTRIKADAMEPSHPSKTVCVPRR